MLIKSAILSALSGSIAGATAAKNRGGTYFRSRVVPINPQTAAQYEVRGNMAAAASGWSGLTATQRQNWSTYAESLDGTNAVGDTKRLSGMNAYVAANSLRFLAGQAALSNAPTLSGKGTFTPPGSAPSVSEGDNEVTIDITLTDSWAATAGGVLFFYVGQPVSAGTSFYKGPWNLYALQVRGVSAPTDPLVLARIGSEVPIVGQRRFCRIRAMDAQGRVAPEYRTLLTIAA